MRTERSFNFTLCTNDFRVLRTSAKRLLFRAGNFELLDYLQVEDFVDEVAAVVGAVGVAVDEAIVDFDFESLLAMQLDSSLLLVVLLAVDVWVIGDG